MNKDTFAEWLTTYADIKPYSIGRYSKAIGTISSELGNYGLQEVNLFTLTDTEFIDTILKNPEFKAKNKKGNNMYSASLNHFKRYIKFFYDPELQAEMIREEQEFEKYLTDNPAEVSTVNIEDKPKERANYRSVSNRKVWSRNPKYASETLADADYLCQFESQHRHFISRFNGKNYVEAHHLIPMQYQELFENSIDIHANIVSVCLVCHKKIHHGMFKDKKEIIDKLFNNRRERLTKAGINIDLNTLYSFYQ